MYPPGGSTNEVGGKLNLAFTLLFHDASGAVIKTMDVRGSMPLSDLPPEQAAALIQQHKEQGNGPDDHQ